MLRSAAKMRAGTMSWIVCAALVLALMLAACRREAGNALPALGTQLEETTVSGLSSGAYMAGQFQIARSSIVKGAAIIAGGPYGCAESVFADLMPGPGTAFLNLSKAMNGCMRNQLSMLGVPDPKLLAKRARTLSQNRRIDPIEKLLDDKVYLFSGKNDTTVMPAIVEAARTFYLELGMSPARIRLISDVPAGHGFVVEEAKLACAATESPYIVDCDYDQAGELLKLLLSDVAPPATRAEGQLSTFDQRPFTQGLADHGLDDSGLVYIPAACRATTGCRVHVVFHGCNQSRAQLGNLFAEASGFARWADSNRLIVLYPQVSSSTINPYGCWDWWGYTGSDYLTRAAPQIVAVGRMLEHLASQPRP